MPTTRSLTVLSDGPAGGTAPSVDETGLRVAFERSAGSAPATVAVATPATGAVVRVAPPPASDGRRDAAATPALSDDRSTVAFVARDRTPGDGESRDAVMAAPLRDGGARPVPGGRLNDGGDPPAIGGDGRLVAFADRDRLVVADRREGTAADRAIDPPQTAAPAVDLTPNGRWLGVVENERTTATAAFDSAVVTDRASGLRERLDGRGALDTTAILDAASTRAPALSADGRYAAYVRDVAGGASEVVLANRATGRIVPIAEAHDTAVAIDDAGRRVAFSSTMPDLVAGDTNGVRDVFVHDRVTGTLTRVSATEDGTGGNGASRDPALSGDGETVVFQSRATNLAGSDATPDADVYSVRLEPPAFPARRPPEPVPDQAVVRSDGTLDLDVLANDRDPDRQSLQLTGTSTATGDARVTAGGTLRFDPDGDADGQAAITYTVQDGDGLTATGHVAVHIEPADGPVIASTGTAGLPAAPDGDLALGPEGKRVAFLSDSGALVADDTNAASDAFLLDRTAGGADRLRRLSATDDGTGPAAGVGGLDLSPDAEAAVFTTAAGNLVAGDSNGVTDAFLKDVGFGDLKRVSVAADGRQGGAPSLAPAVADDGDVVAFVTESDALVSGDANGAADVVVWTDDGTLARISSGVGDARAVDVDAEGRFVAYLDGAPAPGQPSLAVHDRETGTTKRFAVEPDGSAMPSLSAAEIALSGDGSTVIVRHTGGITAIDRESGTRIPVAARPDGPAANAAAYDPSVADDGQRIVFSSAATNLVPGDANGAADAFLRDREARDIDAVVHGAEPESSVIDTAIAGDGEVVAALRDTGTDGELILSEIAGDGAEPRAPLTNGIPSLRDVRLTPDGGQPVTIDLSRAAADPDGDALTFVRQSAPDNGTASVTDDGTLTYTPAITPAAGDSFRVAVRDGNGGTDTATAVVEPAPPARNLVVLGGGEQALRMPFRADVRGTAAAERIEVARAGDISFGAGAGDGVVLPGRLGTYAISQRGNQLVLESGDDATRATLALNDTIEVGFADGVATAAITSTDEGIDITLGGHPVDGPFDPAAVRLGGGEAGNAVEPVGAERGNLTVLNGTAQRLEVPFGADVRGTGAAETLALPGGDGVVGFGGTTGDRLEFPGSLSDSELSRSGNVLTVVSGDSETDLALNGPVELAFTDGTATARIEPGEPVPAILVGGERVGAGFDSEDAAVDPASVSALTPPVSTAPGAGDVGV